MNTAIFKEINGIRAILCSKCGKVVKTEPDFNIIEKYALNGQISLSPQYCDKHKYINMFGQEQKMEKLRRGIKEKLREGIMKKNVLNVEITRPDQVLVIMRGIPGSGKSTKAKELVGEGQIHSTDDLIEATGDYDGHFRRMIESDDWSAHNRMHKLCFKNAKTAMVNGVTPVIIDNTNIRPKEARKYVEAALELGLDENNIKIVDIGLGGQTPEILAERNTHNVPLNVINSMVRTHTSVGELTVKKILNYKGSSQMTNESNYNDDKILYSAVVLDDKSKNLLLNNIHIPYGWKVFAHHMTIVFGKGLDDKNEVGKVVNLTATKLGVSDLAMAVGVDGYPSKNEIPHVTVAVNVMKGGKPFNSNQITNWKPLDEPIKLTGVVQELKA